MTKYLNFFESESGFTEAVEAGQLYYPNVSYTEEDDTVHWNLERPANPVETPMLRMSFSTSTPGQEVNLRNGSGFGVTAMEIDGTPVNYASGGKYSIASPGNHTAVYQFASPAIPERLFWAESGAFDTFTSAEITTAVTAVGYSAFVGCRGLSGVTIPDSVTTIGAQAFVNSGLRSVTIPDSVTTLGGYPFWQCTELRTATVGGGVTAILNQTFGKCTSLQSVALPDGLKFIGNEVFINCHSLHDINIPSGVTTIDGNAFNGCSGLTAIYLNPETPPSLGANALDNTNDCPIYVPAASVEAYQQAWSAYAARIMPMKYTVTASVNDDSLGWVNLWDKTAASEGEKVEFAVVYNPYITQASSITVTDRNGNEVQVTDEGNRVYSFTMPDSDVTISVVLEEKPEGQYKISTVLNDDSLGVVNVLNGETANEGDQVDFDVVVTDPQYQVSNVTVTDGNGNNVQVTDKGDNSYSFTMPGSDVSISVVIGEKPKHTVTVDSTDGHVTDVNFMSDDGEPSFREGDWVYFSFNFDDPDGMFQVGSVQASDCDGNSIEVELIDEGEGRYGCSFGMPGCDVNVFITIEDTRPKYNISASVNDSSLGEVHLDKETLPEGELADIHIDVFNSEANSITSVAVTDGNGNNVECTKDYWDFSHYYFTMPASDVTVSVVIGDKIPEYNISASLNDDSLGTTRVSRTPLPEGEYGFFHVNLNDEEQYQISSVTVTDGNGNNVEWTTYVDASHTHYYQFKMPASDVSAFITIEPKQ